LANACSRIRLRRFEHQRVTIATLSRLQYSVSPQQGDGSPASRAAHPEDPIYPIERRKRAKKENRNEKGAGDEATDQPTESFVRELFL
jgi:hypothetical protein